MAEWSFGETLRVTAEVGRAFEQLGVAWYVGGSVASSVHGIPRATQDADVVAALRPGQGRKLAALLGDGFYIDPDTAETAIRARRSFNLIHFATMFKIDVFVFGRGPYDVRAMRDATEIVVREDPPLTLPMATAEDTVAHKLFWFRRTGERSDKQWTDLQGVLKTLAGDLDRDRLRLACADLGVDDLLPRAWTDAGGAPGGPDA